MIRRVLAAVLGVSLVLFSVPFAPVGATPPPAMVLAWATRTSMPTARYDLGVAAVNGIVYAIGGTLSDSSNTRTGAVEAYDPLTDSWTTKTSMPVGKTGPVAAATNGKIYHMAGYTTGSHADSSVDEYDPIADTWTNRGSTPIFRLDYGLAGASNGKVYAVGGYGCGGVGTGCNTVYEYDPITNTWTLKAPMPTTRYQLGLVAGLNGHLYAMGGVDGTAVAGAVEEYDPTSDVWMARASMPIAAYGFAATVGPNGRIYVIGGFPSVPLDSVVVQAYDPVSDSWTRQTDLSLPHGSTPGAATANASIYVIGGTANGIAVGTVEQGTLATPTFPKGGSFVIGDLNASVGSSVTFWGAQWSTANSTSGGAAPSSFKGFENSNAAPACGGRWTSSGGNSANPPATVPAYIGVIVSSQISKAGSTISGNITEVVVVQTNPGYAPNPGHAGTGTVVAVVPCQ